MAVLSFVKQLTRLFYRLTVGLTVLLIRVGLYFLTSLAVLIALVASVVFVTWRTYTSTHHLGWSACACAFSLVMCGVAVVVGHRVAQDVLGITTLSLGELIGLVFGRQGSGVSAEGDNHGGRGQEAAGGGNPVVLPRRRLARRAASAVSRDYNKIIPFEKKISSRRLSLLCK